MSVVQLIARITSIALTTLHHIRVRVNVIHRPKRTRAPVVVMGNAISVRCVAVNGGHVIEADGSKAIKTQQQSDSKAQQWLVEPKDANHPQEFALKNLANEQYLRAQTGKPYAPCTTGDRQYWAAEPGEAPGSFWLRNLEFADAYLCNCKGLQTANNAVYMGRSRCVIVLL